jgi:hypothetical protein
MITISVAQVRQSGNSKCPKMRENEWVVYKWTEINIPVCSLLKGKTGCSKRKGGMM